MKHSVSRKVRRVFCGDELCDGLHQEPFAVCSCGWSAWVGNVALSATRNEERRVYEAAKAEHLRSAKGTTA